MLAPTTSSVARWAVTLTALSSAVGVEAFANTYPIVAWSDRPLRSLSALKATSSKASNRSPSSSAAQKSFSSSSDAATSAGDLCSLSTILLVSAPGLHYSDLSLLPSSPAGIRARLDHHVDSALTRPYVALGKGSLTAPERIARDFIQQCGAVVEAQDYASFWAGDEAKTVKVDVVEGLEEWQLVGANAREGRREILEKVDETVQGHLHAMQGQYLVVVTSLPLASTQALLSTKQLVKRQEQVDEYEPTLEVEAEAIAALQELENVMDETSTSGSNTAEDDDELSFDGVESKLEDAATNLKDTVSNAVSKEWTYVQAAFAPNQTSIFAVKPNSGLLHRYVFFTPSLILCILISGLILLPLLIFTSQALTTVQTVYGLEHKMTGSVGIDASKSG